MDYKYIRIWLLWQPVVRVREQTKWCEAITEREKKNHHQLTPPTEKKWLTLFNNIAVDHHTIAIAITTAILLNYFNLMLKYSFMKTFFFFYNLFDLIFSNWNSGVPLFIICSLSHAFFFVFVCVEVLLYDFIFLKKKRAWNFVSVLWKG